MQLYADGYDINLRANIKVGEPAVFDININSININRNLCLHYRKIYVIIIFKNLTWKQITTLNIGMAFVWWPSTDS